MDPEVEVASKKLIKDYKDRINKYSAIKRASDTNNKSEYLSRIQEFYYELPGNWLFEPESYNDLVYSLIDSCINLCIAVYAVERRIPEGNDVIVHFKQFRFLDESVHPHYDANNISIGTVDDYIILVPMRTDEIYSKTLVDFRRHMCTIRNDPNLKLLIHAFENYDFSNGRELPPGFQTDPNKRIFCRPTDYTKMLFPNTCFRLGLYEWMVPYGIGYPWANGYYNNYIRLYKTSIISVVVHEVMIKSCYIFIALERKYDMSNGDDGKGTYYFLNRETKTIEVMDLETMIHELGISEFDSLDPVQYDPETFFLDSMVSILNLMFIVVGFYLRKYGSAFMTVPPSARFQFLEDIPVHISEKAKKYTLDSNYRVLEFITMMNDMKIPFHIRTTFTSHPFFGLLKHKDLSLIGRGVSIPRLIKVSDDGNGKLQYERGDNELVPTLYLPDYFHFVGAWGSGSESLLPDIGYTNNHYYKLNQKMIQWTGLDFIRKMT